MTLVEFSFGYLVERIVSVWCVSFQLLSQMCVSRKACLQHNKQHIIVLVSSGEKDDVKSRLS